VAKKSVNMSLDVSLIEDAKAYHLNISQAATNGVRDALRKAKEIEWLKQNDLAIKAYNKMIAKTGNWADEFRQW
jgi:antitoxin CcdA